MHYAGQKYIYYPTLIPICIYLHPKLFDNTLRKHMSTFKKRNRGRYFFYLPLSVTHTYLITIFLLLIIIIPFCGLES